MLSSLLGGEAELNGKSERYMLVTEAKRLPCDLDPEFLSLSVGSGDRWHAQFMLQKPKTRSHN